MCPLCLGTATILVSGTTSASGIALVLLRKHLPKRHTKASPPIAPGADNPAVPRNGACATGGSRAYRSVTEM
jgi:hypothetical protein